MQKKTVFKKIILLFALLFIFPPIDYCQEETPANQLIVAFSKFTPYKMVNGSEYVGIDVEILEAIASRLGLVLVFQECPFSRCLKMMEYGTADIMTGLLKRPDRELYIRYLEPPYGTKSKKVFYVKKGKGSHIRKYEDLYGLRIGITRGVQYFEPFDSDAKVIKEEVTRARQNLEKLEKGRIDAFINTEIQANYLVYSKGYDTLFEKADYYYDGYNPGYFGISRKSKYMDRVDDFETVIETMVKNGEIERIVQEFFEEVKIKTKAGVTYPEE